MGIDIVGLTQLQKPQENQKKTKNKKTNKQFRPMERVWGEAGQVTWGETLWFFVFFVFPWVLRRFWARVAKNSREPKKTKKTKSFDPWKGLRRSWTGDMGCFFCFFCFFWFFHGFGPVFASFRIWIVCMRVCDRSKLQEWKQISRQHDFFNFTHGRHAVNTSKLHQSKTKTTCKTDKTEWMSEVSHCTHIFLSHDCNGEVKVPLRLQPHWSHIIRCIHSIQQLLHPKHFGISDIQKRPPHRPCIAKREFRKIEAAGNHEKHPISAKCKSHGRNFLVFVKIRSNTALLGSTSRCWSIGGGTHRLILNGWQHGSGRLVDCLM